MISGAYEVAASVGDGEQLIAAVAEHDVDLLVIDIDMPTTNGLESLRRIRASGVTTPAIFLTASDDPELVAEAERMGVQGFVVKGFMGHDLMPAIEAVLAGKRFVSPSLDGE